MDAVIFKIKDDTGFYKNITLHFVIGVNLEGRKELFGMWFTNNEGGEITALYCNRFKEEGSKTY